MQSDMTSLNLPVVLDESVFWWCLGPADPVTVGQCTVVGEHGGGDEALNLVITQQTSGLQQHDKLYPSSTSYNLFRTKLTPPPNSR